MRTGFSPLVNPPTSIKSHRGTPTAHARRLVTDLREARNAGERARAFDALRHHVEVTQSVPDQRYLTKVIEAG